MRELEPLDLMEGTEVAIDDLDIESTTWERRWTCWPTKQDTDTARRHP